MKNRSLMTPWFLGLNFPRVPEVQGRADESRCGRESRKSSYERSKYEEVEEVGGILLFICSSLLVDWLHGAADARKPRRLSGRP